MLRVFLVTSPTLEQVPAVAASLRDATPIEAAETILASIELLAFGTALGSALGVEGAPEDALDAPVSGIALIEARAAGASGPLVLVVSELVARAVVTHALDAPVEAHRIAFDPGGIAEIEVRLDSPWTVNRLNDLCHQAPIGDGGIVRT